MDKEKDIDKNFSLKKTHSYICTLKKITVILLVIISIIICKLYIVDYKTIYGTVNQSFLIMDDNQNYRELLSAYHLGQEINDVQTYFEKDNIWKILDIQRYEPSHSAFLAWFLNQDIVQYTQVKAMLHLLIAKADYSLLENGWNNTGDMRYFADSVLTGAYKIKTVSITPEQTVNKISNIRYSDKIDIYIRCSIALLNKKGDEDEKTLEIILENKVDSPEGKDKTLALSNPSPEEIEYKKMFQTNRYFYACSKESGNRKTSNNVDYQLFVYLTPNRKKSDNKNYILITYQDIVDNIFISYMRRDDINQYTRELVESYLHNLGNPFNKNNKEIIAMTTEERDLLVRFFEQNKKLFMATIEAMRLKYASEGDSDSAEEFAQIGNQLKTAGKRRHYTINGTGNYMMYEVIEEYIRFKLGNGETFANIKALIENTWKVGPKYISDKSNDVIIGSSGTKPHTFDYTDSLGNNKTYYVTKELADKLKSDRFYKFRTAVNKNETGFRVVEIK